MHDTKGNIKRGEIFTPGDFEKRVQMLVSPLEIPVALQSDCLESLSVRRRRVSVHKVQPIN